MNASRILILCTAPHGADAEEIQGWLRGRVQTLVPNATALYRLAPSANEGADAPREWLIELDGPRAEGQYLEVLVAELRMLGLGPALFRARESATALPAHA